MNKLRIAWTTLCIVLSLISEGFGQSILIEAESFQNHGGWVVDQQSFDVIQSSYLMAHGMGKPVKDASTTVQIGEPGQYTVWIKTKDWAPYPQGPGKYTLNIDGRQIGKVLGSDGDSRWRWIFVDRVELDTTITIKLKDLTGFNGRVDAIIITKEDINNDSNSQSRLGEIRLELAKDQFVMQEAGTFDLVVVGGGMAGTCAAINASRQGLTVALIQNRPVLGGNNSSEVRVHLMGNWHQNHYAGLGRIVRELDNGDPGNGNPEGKKYGDDRKLAIARAEKNLHLFLNTHVHQVEMKNDQIQAVIGRHIKTNQEFRFEGSYFADCTGDGTVGFLSGADFRMGRESKSQTQEPSAPNNSDNFTLGTSNLWAAQRKSMESSFPECPWTIQFSDEYHIDQFQSDWQWETGFGNFNTITQAEEIRDHNLRAIYGNWSFLKNQKADKYKFYELVWVAYIGGKRESRRLLGDHILTETDIVNGVQYPDGCVTATWTIDLHFPEASNSKYFPGEEFFASTKHIRVKPYTIPYRCLYSRNITNLFMAGRDISTTHIAFGSTRVMRTCGMMGEVVGFAAYLCKKHNTIPRGVYQNHLSELISLIE